MRSLLWPTVFAWLSAPAWFSALPVRPQILISAPSRISTPFRSASTLNRFHRLWDGESALFLNQLIRKSLGSFFLLNIQFTWRFGCRGSCTCGRFRRWDWWLIRSLTKRKDIIFELWPSVIFSVVYLILRLSCKTRICNSKSPLTAWQY